MSSAGPGGGASAHVDPPCSVRAGPPDRAAEMDGRRWQSGGQSRSVRRRRRRWRRRPPSGTDRPIVGVLVIACHRFRLISITFLDIANTSTTVQLATSFASPAPITARGAIAGWSAPIGEPNLRARTPAVHRPPHRGARPRACRRSGAAIRRLGRDDPQGPGRPGGGRPSDARPRRRDQRGRATGRKAPSRCASALQPDAKDHIGRLAAGMVVDGESIAFDASTTALAVARHLKARGGWVALTVITNGLRIASELAGYPGHHGRDARRLRAVGGPVGRRPAGRRSLPEGQRPKGVPWRRGLQP